MEGVCTDFASGRQDLWCRFGTGRLRAGQAPCFNEAIQASSATADQKERARKAFAAYEATFAATQTPTSDQDVAHIRFSLKAHSQNLA